MRRLVIAMGDAAERRAFRLGWSRWRRTHQAGAARCHAARRARRDAALPPTRAAPPPASADAGLTEDEWRRAAPALPPQKPTTGRPRHDHRTVLAGILWVVRSGASWRAMPEDYGTWATAYHRYRLWCTTGLWPRMLEALGGRRPGRRGDALPLDADTGRVTPVRVPRGDAEGSTVQRSDQGASGFAYVGYRGPWGWAWMEYLR